MFSFNKKISNKEGLIKTLSIKVVVCKNKIGYAREEIDNCKRLIDTRKKWGEEYKSSYIRMIMNSDIEVDNQERIEHESAIESHLDDIAKLKRRIEELKMETIPNQEKFIRLYQETIEKLKKDNTSAEECYIELINKLYVF